MSANKLIISGNNKIFADVHAQPGLKTYLYDLNLWENHKPDKSMAHALKTALGEKKTVFVHTIEGAHSLGRAVNGIVPDYSGNLKALINKGVRMLTLAHFYENDIAWHVVGLPPEYYPPIANNQNVKGGPHG